VLSPFLPEVVAIDDNGAVAENVEVPVDHSDEEATTWMSLVRHETRARRSTHQRYCHRGLEACLTDIDQ
jgi:hypothetical protein